MFKKDFVKIAESTLFCRMLGENKHVPLSKIRRISVDYSGIGDFFAAWTVEAGDDVIIWDNQTNGAREVVYELERQLKGFSLAKINEHIRTAPIHGSVEVWPEIVQQELSDAGPSDRGVSSSSTSRAELESFYAALRRIRAIRQWQYAHRWHFVIAMVAVMVVAELYASIALLMLPLALWYGSLRLYFQRCPRCGKLYHSPWSISHEYHNSTIWSDLNECNSCGLAMSELPELNRKPSTIFG